MIRVLDKNIADKIAAGEVIDRPVSIVKELTENALDAEATSITIELRKGGREYLRVTDNGCGIPAEEVQMAFLRHATSKIETESDLDAIRSLGFRGEALASICAVARVDMITKTRDAHTGRHIVVEGSEILEDAPTGCPDGTTITVRDLFYNVPARRKFLSSDGAEARRIIDLVSRIALAYPDVRFRLINGKQEVFQTTGRGNILDCIIRIYGRDMARDLVPVEARQEPFLLKGFISSPGTSSSSRNRQFFCVNGRVVSSHAMEIGLEKGYRERLFPGRFPIAFLFLHLPADQLDVNVHPTKKEIRFDDPIAVEDFITDAVTAALHKEQAIPAASGGHAEEGGSSASPVPAGTQQLPKGSEILKGPEFPKEPAVLKRPADPVFADPIFEEANKSSNAQVDIKNILNTLREEADSDQKLAEESFHYGASSENREKKLHIEDLEVIGTVFRTYIIASEGDVMYLIDQHAAHERVFYELLLAQYHNADKPQQTMLLPLQITVSADVESMEDQWIGHLRDMGYDIEYFGSRTYLVRSMPAFAQPEEGEAFLRQMLLELESAPDLRNFASLDRLIMRSCKSAIKGGDALHPEEVRSLLNQLADCRNPWSCPHGRPTIVKMTKYELEKMFKRV